MKTTENGTAQSSQESVSPYGEERYLGKVAESGLSSAKIMLDSNTTVNLQVGDYTLVKMAGHALFSQVVTIRLETIPGSNAEPVPIASINLISTIDFSTLAVSPGIAGAPGLGTSVYLSHPEIVKMVAESGSIKGGKKAAVTLDFAHLADGQDTPISITPEMLFGKHMAILGTTGAGKSYSISRLAEEVGKHRSKLILFDASGEFGSLDENTLQVYIGNHPKPAENQFEVSVPYYELIENDLFAIFRPTGVGQAPKLRQAIKTLKLAKLAPEVALNGTVMKANKAKLEYERNYEIFHTQIESAEADFDIAHLVTQINNECCNPNRSAVETGYWGDINSLDLAHCTPLVNRIQDIITSTNLASIFQPGKRPSLFQAIDRFLADDQYRILCISLQYLSFQHHAREIVANAAGRYLLEMARAERFQNMPVLVAVDEAHQFLKEKLQNLDGEYPLDSFALIAKEGRKYSLHICLATQRPRDVPESVLSQMGTLIVHRLINDRDRGIIERASGEADGSSLATLPALSQGQAILLGVDFPAPLKVQVRMPNSPPLSKNADFQKCWLIP